jgi:hypothetical protein
VALSNSFGAATYTLTDVENLISGIDRDPENMDKVYKFGNALYGQVPFPAALFTAAKNEMLRRYSQIHIPQAASDEAAARRAMWSNHDPNRAVTEDGEDFEVTITQGRHSRILYAYERFEGIADSNAATMAHVASETMKADRERKERQQAQQEAQSGAEGGNIAAATVQAGKLTKPVTAPRVARFKPRMASPSR